nr:TRAP transporter large permease subunit [uncultured Roseobacter sp.]
MLFARCNSCLTCGPILKPSANEVRMTDFQFRIKKVTGLGAGTIVPPLGLNRFVITGLTDTSLLKIASRAVPFVIFLSLTVLMIADVTTVSPLLLDDIYE